jgi:pyruvate/2-oxoglutarate dehydrogenase complex dihydrolipoamide dehydrogenase (E3) component
VARFDFAGPPTAEAGGALGRDAESAVIVGAGYIGLEKTEALHARRLKVTIVEQLATVPPTVDPRLGTRVRAELEQHGVRVIDGVTVTAIDEHEGRLTIRGDPSLTLDAEVVLGVMGIKPDGELGHAAGIATETRGALQVNRRMETNVPDVHAAGDCVTTYHRLLRTDGDLPLGTTRAQARTRGG